LGTSLLGQSGKLKFHTISSLAEMDTQLCNGHPVIVGVELDASRRPSHFVVVTGKENGEYTIADPFFNRTSLSDPAYANNFVIRGYIADPPHDLSELNVAVGADLDAITLAMIDPLGRETGGFGISGSTDIPNSSYTRDILVNDESLVQVLGESHFLDILQPSPGSYRVEVSGSRLGQFSVTLSSLDSNGTLQNTSAFQGVSSAGSQSTFSVQFDPAPGSIASVARVATFSSIRVDISNLALLGLIDTEEANELTRIITAAESVNVNGEPKASHQIILAFNNRLSSQPARKITTLAAKILSEDADWLLGSIK